VLAAIALPVLYIVIDSRKKLNRRGKKQRRNNKMHTAAGRETHVPYHERLSKYLPADIKHQAGVSDLIITISHKKVHSNETSNTLKKKHNLA
jgi:hypothetical protein